MNTLAKQAIEQEAAVTRGRELVQQIRALLRPSTAKFDPAQPRDVQGQWTKTQASAVQALTDLVGSAPMGWNDRPPVKVEDHPVAIRAAHETAAVLAEMKAKGYRLPSAVLVQVQDALSGEAEEENTLVVRVPKNLPPDVSLDQAYAVAYSGAIAVVEDGELLGQIRKFAGTKFRDLVVHEMGHLLRRSTLSSPYITRRSSPEDVARAEASAQQNIKEMEAHKVFAHEARAHVSDYAAHNPDEFVAEVFTLLYNGATLPESTLRAYHGERGAVVR